MLLKKIVTEICLVLFFCLVFWKPAGADELPHYLAWGALPDRASCPISHGGVWSEYVGGHDCIRYFTGGNLEQAPVVVVVFYGDRDGYLSWPIADIPDNTDEAQSAYARRLAKVMGLPVVIIARPGTYGSSGDHHKRRQVQEFLALNAAVDGIVSLYQIKRLVLMGHSGGATAAAALLTLGRNDISCAVLTSGAYGLLERAQLMRIRNRQPQQPGIDLTGYPAPYDPLEHVNGVVPDSGRLIVIMGNEEDRITPFEFQRAFAEALRSRGHRVDLVNQAALPPDFHNLEGRPARNVAKRCAASRTQE